MLHFRQMKTKLTCTENFVKFGHVDFEIYEQTLTDTLIAIFKTPSGLK